MNDNKLKQKVQRGGALFLVAVMCFTGLVGCGTKKPNKDLNKKPGTTQVEPNKKPTSNKPGKTDIGKKDDKPAGKVDGDKKDSKEDIGKIDEGKKDDKDTDKKDDKGAAGTLDKAPVKNPVKDSGQKEPGTTDTTQKDSGKKDGNGTDKKDTVKKDKTSKKKGNAKAPTINKAPVSGKTGSKGGK